MKGLQPLLALTALLITPYLYAYIPDCDNPDTKNERLVCATLNRVKKDINMVAEDLQKKGFDTGYKKNFKQSLTKNTNNTSTQAEQNPNNKEPIENTKENEAPETTTASTEPPPPTTLYEIH